MQPIQNNDERTDLRHDNMEYSASTDGDDILDTDDLEDEEDEISGEELDALEAENDSDREAALKAVEVDRLEDPENMPEESDEDDYYDNDEEEEKTQEYQRHTFNNPKPI